MDISLVKLLLLLWALLAHGNPDSWAVAWQVRFSVYLPDDPGVAISVAWDPVPIYYRPLPGELCGEYRGGAVLIDPRAPEKGCGRTLEHELAHVWQARSYGLLYPISYALSPSPWEPAERPWEEVPPAQKVLEWSLVRLWLPITR